MIGIMAFWLGIMKIAETSGIVSIIAKLIKPITKKLFNELPEYDTEMYTHKKMKTTEETSLEVLKDLLPRLEAHDEYTNDALYALLMKYVEEKGCKNGYAIWPLRTAVSGKQMTPAGATEIMEIIGKDETIARVKKGIELLEAKLA